MYLSTLKIWNFRKYGSKNKLFSEDKLRDPDLEVNFTKGLNVLIGENDSGKSTIIDAIKHVLNTHSSEWIRLDTDDFYEDNKNGVSTRLRIECRFDDLRPYEAKNFTEWIGVEGEGENAKIYLKVFLDARRNSERIFSFEIRAGADDTGSRLGGEAKEYLKTTYLRPLRDAKRELIPKRNSRLSQILQGHEIFKGKNDTHQLVDKFKRYGKKIEEYFTKQQEDGHEIKEALEETLLYFFGNRKNSNFGLTNKDLRRILETLELTLEDGKLGLGSHNLLFIAAELLNLKRRPWSGLRLGLIEELEAHLHPQAQMRVIETLQNEEDVQFILTTHSPNLASKVNLKNIILCAEDTNAVPATFPMGPTYTERGLAEADYKFLERFLDVTKSNLFFAKGVILVEGWSEEILLPALAKKLEMDLTKEGVSIVNVAGISFVRYSNIFQRTKEPYIGMPVAVVADLDVDANNEPKKSKDALINKMNKYSGQNVKSFISPSRTLEYCLAKSKSLGDIFKDVVTSIHSRIFNGNNFHKTLEKALDNNKLNKAEIASKLAQCIEDDNKREKSQIIINSEDEYIKYLLDAIKYATGKD